MRKIALASATATMLFGAVQAHAADMAVKAPHYAAPAAVFTWSGAYVGGEVGGIWGRHNDTVNGISTLAAPPDCGGAVVCSFATSSGWQSSVIGGVATGYRFQRGPWVFGFEQDIRFTNLRNSVTLTGAAPLAAGPFVAGTTITNRLNWMADTRAQLGVAWDRVLVYAAGGLATASMDAGASFPIVAGGPVAFSSTDSHKYHIGWTAGAGIEWAMTDNVSLGAEYRYTRLSNETYNLGTFVGAGNVRTITTDVDFRSSEVLARLNIKFDYLTHMFGL